MAWTVNCWQEIKRFDFDVLSTFHEKNSHTAYVYLSDVFKIPLDKIEVSQRYQTRQLNNIFVDDIKDAMLQELSLDSVVYVASVGNPFHDNHLLKEESSLYILGGTHYL